MDRPHHPFLPPARTGAGEELEQLRREVAAQTQHLQAHVRSQDLRRHPLVQRSEALTQRLQAAARVGDPWRHRHAAPRPRGRLKAALRTYLTQLAAEAAKDGRLLHRETVRADCARHLGVKEVPLRVFLSLFLDDGVVPKGLRKKGRKPRIDWQE